MSGGISVTFHGVRGSTPCDDPRLARYGGNTSCVVIDAPDHDPIVLDLGTGLRAYGAEVVEAGKADGWHGHVLLSHLHWDHVQGLPFFTPLHHAASAVDIHGPAHPEGPLGEVFERFMGPPFFPIRPSDLSARITFHDVTPGRFALGDAKVTAAPVRHTGPTLGFRVELGDVVVVYIPDHGPGCSHEHPDVHVPADVLDLCAGADLLIHDAQHTVAEYADKRHWGHSTIDYAVEVARRSGARSLALFHHDPTHCDESIDRNEAHARALLGPDAQCTIIAAREGLRLDLVPSVTGGDGARGSAP
jgi:ribonuclease BN (tRNA processing enzyme)